MKFEDYDLRLLDEDVLRRRRGYWFPYWFKNVAWFLTLGTIAICSTYLLLYGLTFGLVKCYLWLTAVIISVILSGVVIQPAKIIFLAAILSGLIKSPPALQLKRIQKDILENPYDELKAIQAYRFRFDNAHLYKPMPAYKLQSRSENIKYHLEQRKLFVEVLIYIVFMLTLVYLVVEHGSGATNYSTNVVKHLVVFGSYTNSIPLTEVTSYEQFLEYVNRTLFPALFGSTEGELYPIGSKRTRETNRKRRKSRRISDSTPKTPPTWEEERIRIVRQQYEIAANESQKNVTNIYERSWTMDRSLKLIGKLRMRQLRVKNNTCNVSKYIKPRQRLCFAEYSWLNKERRNFTLWWLPVMDEALTPSERLPWIYQTSWSTGGIYLVGMHSSYPGGGYVLEFAKSISDSRIILEFMDTFHWIDSGTRAVIIEFTLYSVNVNLFNVVHLIVEKSGSGYLITSYQIDTAKFMFLASELELISICMIVVFVLLIFLFTVRQAIRVERTSFQAYITKGNPTVDILIITLGLITVVFIFLRSYYVSSLLKKLDNSQNNVFVSFAYAAVWNSIATYILTALVTLTAVKFFQILRFRVVFLQLQETLRGSYRYFAALSLQLFALLVAFSLFFHLLLASYDFHFSTFGRTMSKLIGLIACLGKSCDTSIYSYTPWYVAPIFYILYVLSILILIVAFFTAVICYYLGRIKSTRIENKYDALAYFKHVLTANEKTDILRLRGGSSAFSDASPMRLRGGGGFCSRICLGDKNAYQFPPKYKGDSVVVKRGEPILARAKVYDFYAPYRVTDLSRFEVMKSLVKAHLTSEKATKEIERQNAMKAIIYRKLTPLNSLKEGMPQEFYRGRDKHEKWIVSTERLLEMKKIVDAYGREKLFEKYNNAGLTLVIIEDQEEDTSQFVSVLDTKMLELKTVVDEKYKEEKKRRREERKSSTAAKDANSVKQ